MTSSSPTVSGVVLLVPQHIAFFCEDLVPNLASMTTPFDELLVVASGFSSHAMRRVEDTLKLLSGQPNKKVIRVPLGSVGANRNHGIEHSTSDFVTFLDSDDLYSPGYCAFLKNAYARQPYQVLLHSYIAMSRSETRAPVFDSLSTAIDDVFFTNKDFFTNPSDDWKSNPENLISTTLQFRDKKNNQPIHQGHMTLSRDFPIRFHEDPIARNEDGVFLQQCLANGFRVHFYPVRLSAYRLDSSASPVRYRILRRMDTILRRRPRR